MAKGILNYTPLVPLTKKDVVNNLTSNVTDLPGSAANDKALKDLIDGQKTDLENKINAARYTHPATHPATMIAQDSTHRFVTDTWLQAQADQYNNIITQLNAIKTSISALPSKSDVSAVTTAVNATVTSINNNTNTRKNELATAITAAQNNVNAYTLARKNELASLISANASAIKSVQVYQGSINGNASITLYQGADAYTRKVMYYITPADFRYPDSLIVCRSSEYSPASFNKIYLQNTLNTAQNYKVVAVEFN